MDLSQLIIAGARSGGPIIEIRNPATLEKVGTVASGTEADLDRAVVAAGKALNGPWTDEALRIKALNDIADVLEQETESLARLIVQEQGKPLLAFIPVFDIPILRRRCFASHAAYRLGLAFVDALKRQ